MNPLLLIHGIDDTCALFNRMRPFLENLGRVVHCLDLAPSNGGIGLEQSAAQVADYVERVFAAAEKIDVVGFSMGGLIARYYVQRLGGANRVLRLITIAAPHQGSWMAYLRGNTGARQMRPGSDFLRDLNGETEALKRVDLTSIWTPFDLMIVPANSSVMREACSVRVNVVAHPWMVRDRRVFRIVQETLKQPKKT